MKTQGFTIAEVLITLVIIGVVAAITVPTLMNNTNKEEFKTGYKKAITSINQAITMHYSLEGLNVQSYKTKEDLVNNLLKKRMNILEGSAPTEFTYGCKNGVVFKTTDGIIYCVSDEYYVDTNEKENAPCNYANTIPCTKTGKGPNLWIDVNGERKPNKITSSSDNPQDVYVAQIFSQKVIPYGSPIQSIFYNKSIKDNEESDDKLDKDAEDFFKWIGLIK